MNVISYSPIYEYNDRLFIDVVIQHKNKKEIVKLVKRKHDKKWVLQPSLKQWEKEELKLFLAQFKKRGSAK